MIDNTDKNFMAFYIKTRAESSIYQRIKQKATILITKYSHLPPVLVGSHAMGVDIPGSDIDFAIGSLNQSQKMEMKECFENIMEFRGERPATLTSTRFLFCTKIDGVHIDLNIMDQSDYVHLITGMRIAKSSLTIEEKAACVFKKISLKQTNKDEFEKYKLDLYQRFCPNLLWLPDFQIRGLIEKHCLEQRKSLPQWLLEKKQHEKT